MENVLSTRYMFIVYSTNNTKNIPINNNVKNTKTRYIQMWLPQIRNYEWEKKLIGLNSFDMYVMHVETN